MILQQNDYVLEHEVENIISFVKEKRLQGIICLWGNFIDGTENSFESLGISIVITIDYLFLREDNHG